ncbi:protein FAM174C [Sardina pilchardus]|uniref:protein FAM174C n=1 Tax=Sardina pilchardus TaxID=27697 RepID=UPI002E0EF29C
MTLRVVFVLVPIFWALAIATDATNSSTTASAPDKPVVISKPTNNSVVAPDGSHKDTGTNTTATPQNKVKGHFDTDSSMIQRALYVLIGITVIGVLYFLVRAVRLKKTSVSQRKKKYGLLANHDDDDDEDDDDIVYESRSLRR